MRFLAAKYFKKIYQAKQPIVVIYGGRNSGKSVGVADLICQRMHAERIDALVLRQFLDSTKDSVHKVFKGSIESRLNLQGWDITEQTCRSPRGGYTSYKGANRNPGAMKSAEEFLISWGEEAQDFTEESLDTLLPTILRRKGARCFFTLNPRSEADPASQQLIVPFKHEVDKHGFYEDDLHLIVKANWRDNPFFDETADKLRLKAMDTMSAARYNWIWEGEFYDEIAGSIITLEEFNSCVDAHEKLGFKPTGAIVATHDPADVGDARGFAVRHGSVLLEADCTTALDINDSCDWAMAKARKHQADFFVYDADGVGLSLRRQVSEYFKNQRTSVREFKGGSSPKNPTQAFMHEDSRHHDFDMPVRKITNQDAFFNLRAHCYFELADRMRKTHEAITKGSYIDPDQLFSISSKCTMIEQLKTELCRLPQKHNISGKFQLENKKDMWRLHGIKSPNIADCVMMSMLDVNIQSGWDKPLFPTVSTM